MASKKVKVPAAWNAKPVSKPGGASGGVRNPSKPYAKPSNKPSNPRQSAKPAPAAPKPVTRRSRVNGRVVAGTDTRGNRPAPAKPAAQPAKPPAKPPVKPSGTFKAPDIPKPARTAAQPPAKPSLRSALRGGVGKGNAAIIALSAANAVQDSLMTPEQRKRKAEAEIRPLTMADMPGIGGGSRGVRTGTASGRTGRGGTTADARTSTAAKPRVSNIPPAEGTGRGGPSDVKKTRTQTPTKPTAASTPSSSPSPRRQASSSGSGGTTRPRSSSAPSTSSNAGMKNQDKNYRGSLFEKTFGYKPGQAPDQLKMKDNFDTKSDIYSPSTKVDGSNLDALKIDQKKVNEYTRRKRRYYD